MHTSCRTVAIDRRVSTAFFQVGPGKCPDTAGRGHPGRRQANRRHLSARDGKSEEKLFQNYHRVLNRARWSAIEAARVLLRMLVNAFAISGELVIGLDYTIERRRGAKIKAKGIYRDPVRSSQSHFVKASGLRWLCSMLLVEIPWAGCVWGCHF